MIRAAAPQVAVVAHEWDRPEPTGIGRYYRSLADGLARVLHGDDGRGAGGARAGRVGTDPGGRRWDVSLVGVGEDPSLGTLLPASLGVHRVPGPRQATFGAWCTLGRPRLDRFIGRPDLVHSLHPIAPVPTRAPLVVTAHDTIPVEHPDWYRPTVRFTYRRAYAQLAEAAAVIVDSADVRERVLALTAVSPDRIAIVHLGVSDTFRERVDPATAAEAAASVGSTPGGYLLVLGQVSTRKNLAVVLEALARCRPTGGVELVAAGPDAAGADEVRAKAVELGLADRVRFAGFVEGHRLPALVQAAGAVLLPSLAEGFGLTALEAMAAGVPVLASDAGSLPEVVADGGRLLPPGDADAWAEAIVRLRDDREHRRDLVAAGDRRQSAFTWEATAIHTMQVWAAVLDGSPLPG